TRRASELLQHKTTKHAGQAEREKQQPTAQPHASNQKKPTKRYQAEQAEMEGSIPSLAPCMQEITERYTPHMSMPVNYKHAVDSKTEQQPFPGGGSGGPSAQRAELQ